jgi:tetratricopeptide (TPR) repeat protein
VAVKAGEASRAQEAAGAIWRFWQQRGHLTEGRRWLEEVLALPSGQGPTPARAKALAGAGGIAWWQEDIAAARGFYEEALAIERALGDPAGIAQALYNQSFVVAADGDFDGAFGLLQESRELARRAGDEPAAAWAKWMLPSGDLAAGAWSARWPSPSRPWPPGAGSGTASRWATPGLAGRRLRPCRPPGRRPVGHR